MSTNSPNQGPPKNSELLSSPASGFSENTAARKLNSWKEIAAYMGRSVRSVQRMEVSLGLPVRRIAGHPRSSVMAFSEELDEWLKSFPAQRTVSFDEMMTGSELSADAGNAEIVVVDDQKLNSYAINRILSTNGYKVFTADSGREALELITSRTQLILLDVNLPDIHGFEVLRRLRCNINTAQIPVICTSATYEPEGAAPLALQLGAKRFLKHPVHPRTLTQVVAEVLTTATHLASRAE
jgi:CheY-like chemotaxis protein